MTATLDSKITTAAPGRASDAPNQRIPALEGLRGLAVIGVLLFHDDRLVGGFLGVDLFFVLSGFLITGLLIDERRRTGTIALTSFWRRRARRLLPALLALVAVMIPVMYWLGSPSQLKSAREGAFPALLYMSNWQQIGEGADYWALFSDPSPMTHLWSLAVEGQFYLFWPVVFYAVTRRQNWRRWIGVVTLAGIVASATALVVLYEPSNVSRAYIGSDTRVAAILFGALLAIVAVPDLVSRSADHRPKLTAVSTEVLHVALVAGIAWSWLTVDGTGDGLYRGGMLVHSVAAGLLISTVGLRRPTMVQRVCSWRALTAIGAISYSLYLWHWPVFLILNEDRLGTDGLPLSMLRWAVSICAALASYRLVETPIRRRQWLTTNRSLFTAGGLAIGAIAVMVIAIPSPDTTPAAFDPDSIVTATATSLETATAVSGVPLVPATPNSVQSDTDVEGENAPVATEPSATLPVRRISTVMWQGDSVAFDAAPGIVAALSAAGLSAENVTAVGAGLVDPTPEFHSLAYFGDPIVARQPDVVIFQLSGWDAGHTEPEQRSAFAAYTELVLDTSATLVFVTPPPVDATRVASNVDFMQQLAESLAAERPDRVSVWDSAALWGPFAYDTNGDGVPERKRDGVHVCPQGSAVMGAWLAQQLDTYFDGVAPAPPSEWATGSWVTEQRYDNPLGACA